MKIGEREKSHFNEGIIFSQKFPLKKKIKSAKITKVKNTSTNRSPENCLNLEKKEEKEKTKTLCELP